MLDDHKVRVVAKLMSGEVEVDAFHPKMFRKR